jgi:hypothetical protein
MTAGSIGRQEDSAAVTCAVGLTVVPDSIRGVAELADLDYVDVFTATTSAAADRSAEEWARVALEDTPTGRSAPMLWRLLGLRLGPMPSPDHVQGWRIADRGDDWIRIETASWLMTAHAVVQADDEHVSLALFVRYDNPIAAFVWPPVSVMHRRAVPVILRQALDARGLRRRDRDRDDAASACSTSSVSDHAGTRPRRPTMRISNTEFTARPWRIHEFTRNFRLEDVWALPAVGGPDDFARLVQLIADGDPEHRSSAVAGALFAIRWKLGALLGWDAPSTGVGARVPTLRDRLSADLSNGPSGPRFDALPFTSLYLTRDEWAAEIANRTMHGVMHIGLVSEPGGGCRAQMAVLVKPNGLLGRAYMTAIRPFRHLIVYPAIMREIERTWHDVRDPH